MTGPKQFATFHLEGMLFGVEVLKVQEVIRYQEMTPVPMAPAMIEGLINLRGQIITAIDLRRRFDMPARAPGQLPMNVVVRTDDGAVSLLDEIGDVLEVQGDSYEKPPPTLTGLARELILGIYKLKTQSLLILDTKRAVRVPEGNIPAQLAGSGMTNVE